MCRVLLFDCQAHQRTCTICMAMSFGRSEVKVNQSRGGEALAAAAMFVSWNKIERFLWSGGKKTKKVFCGEVKVERNWQVSDTLAQWSVGRRFGVDDSPREKNVNYLLSPPEVLVSCQVVHDGAKPQLVGTKYRGSGLIHLLHPSCRAFAGAAV